MDYLPPQLDRSFHSSTKHDNDVAYWRERAMNAEKLLTINPILKKEFLFHFGNNWIDFKGFEAKGINGVIQLTKKENLLMKLLIDNKNQVVSREHILKVVWDYTVIPNTRTIDNFVLNLRKYFEEDAKNPQFIQSVRGIGYKFVLK